MLRLRTTLKQLHWDKDVPAVLLAAALLAASPISYVCPLRVDEAFTPVISDGKIPGQIVLTLIFILPC